MLRFVRERLESEEVDARIDFVFSNRAPGEAEGSDEYFKLVADYGIPLFTHSSAEFRKRTGGRFADHRTRYDAEVLDLLSGQRPDICVLAGYMLIASSSLCRAFPLLNLHPALPDGPIGTWQEVVWQLIVQRADLTGAMMHLATEEVDRGPLVSYVTVPLKTPELMPHWQKLEGNYLSEIRQRFGEEYDLFKLIRAEQYRREPYLLLETLRSLSLGEVALDLASVGEEVSVSAGRVFDPHGYGGLCLDRRIEETMSRDA